MHWFDPDVQHRIRSLLDLISRTPFLTIPATEVTQAIQYSRASMHLTDPANHRPDNSVRLVAGKAAWVRVYVRTLFYPLENVTGTLEVRRRVFFNLSVPVATLSPEPPGQVTAHLNPDYDAERSTLSQTLNFIVPAHLMCGKMELVARIQGGGAQRQRVIRINASLRQTLRIAGVMIAYNGPADLDEDSPNLNLPAPTLTELQTTAALTHTLYPVRAARGIDFRIAATINWDRPLRDAATSQGGCSPNWNALWSAVIQARTADGNQAGWVYYGLLPTNQPIGPIGGCGGSGVGVSRAGDQGIMAHEIGHACGLSHGPCGSVGTSADPDYPAYGPYDQGSIGEYGLDINNGDIKSPDLFKDFMSYCGPRWISLYHYERLVNNARLNPSLGCLTWPWWFKLRDIADRHDPRIMAVLEKINDIVRRPPLPDPPPFDFEMPVLPPPLPPVNVISIIVAVSRDGTVHVEHVARTRARAELEGAVRTTMSVRLRGERDNVLAEAPLLRLPTHACGCAESADDGGPFLAQALLPDVAPGAAIEIVDGDKVIWSRRAHEHPARIDRFDCNVTKGDQLNASWEVRAAPGAVLDYWLRWSLDGETWNGLTVGIKSERANVSIASLPSGQVFIHLMVHDGYFSTSSKAVPIDVPRRRPQVAILHPADDGIYWSSETLRLACTSSGDDAVEIADDRHVWSLDGREIGRGPELFIAAPTAGKHELVLRVEHEAGAGEAKVFFRTIDAPQLPGDQIRTESQ